MATTVQAVPQDDLMLLLSQATHTLNTELTAALAGLGISPRAHCVLSKAMPGDLTQTQLAELAGLDKTTMVATIDELERAGLAERRPSAKDRRVRIIAVTDAGRRMVADAQTIVDRIHDEVLAALPEPQRHAFLEALAQLVAGPLCHPVQCGRPVRRPI